MTTKKAIDSIHSKLDKIALKGKDNYLEYSNYFKDLSTNGNYDNLLQCLYIYYSVDIEKPIVSISNFKKDTWKSILFKTDSNINKKIKIEETKIRRRNVADFFNGFRCRNDYGSKN